MSSASPAAAAPAPHPVFNNAVGGALCLDFTNTTGGWLPGDVQGGSRPADVVRVERLTTYDRLVEWARWIGVLDDDAARALQAGGRANPRGAATVLRRALRLRQAIYGLGRAAVNDRPPSPDDLDVVNHEMQIARTHQRLVARRSRGATAVVALAWTDDAALDAMLWPVALSAVELLAGDRGHRLGRCPAAGCGWLFEDTSRAGRRQWCDMAVCGNAEKVRRFRERQQHARARGRRQ